MTTKFRSLLTAGVLAAALAGIGAAQAGNQTGGDGIESLEHAPYKVAPIQVAGQQLQLQAKPITACGLKFKKVKEDSKSYLCRLTIKPACAKGYNIFGLKLVGNKVEYLCAKPVG